jgi:NADPH-dependent 2,4-dienoyl-CoA reductase/sulfur reductase-like enzyme
MPNYRYLIVGGGLTADGACKGIRDVDQEGSIGVVGSEPHPPYLRPPLSKDLWKGKPEEKIWRGTSDLGVELHLSRTVVSLDLSKHEATDSEGETYAYERLLLATGGTPRRLPFGGDDVIYYRTLDDYRRLRTFADGHARSVVIGGGFIGSEVAAALALNECPVTMVFPDPGVCARIFPADLTAFVTDYYRDKGVEVLSGESVTGIERDGDHVHVATGQGQTLEADVVVAGLGIQPNTELAEAAGLPVDDGIPVDEFGRVGGREDVFAAGDVARFPRPVWTNPCASSTRTTRRPTDERSASTWPARTRPTTISRSSTRTCSTWATRRSATSTRDRKRSRSGRRRTRRVSSTTSTASGVRGASCCGTCSGTSTTRRS